MQADGSGGMSQMCQVKNLTDRTNNRIEEKPNVNKRVEEGVLLVKHVYEQRTVERRIPSGIALNL